MAYGELGSKTLKWAAQNVFGLKPESIPARILITPLKVEDFFEGFQVAITREGLIFDKVGNSFLVSKGNRQVLFSEGDTGASNFADSSYILCHCRSVEEIIFVGTGGGIGEHVKSADINIPPSCIRLDKVLEIFLPPEAPANADRQLERELKSEIRKTVGKLGVKVHSGVHATVPFFLSETKLLLTNLQKQGVLSVDMELSVLYALTNHYNKKAVGIIRIGDLPIKGLPAWKSRSSKLRLKREVHAKILHGIINYFFG